MIEVKVQFKEGVEKTYSFDKEQVFFGKHPANDIPLNSGAVGLRHARLCKYRGMWWAEDLKSPTGTRLNGEVLSAPAVVSAGDRIEIADVKISVLRAGVVQTPAPAPAAVTSELTSSRQGARAEAPRPSGLGQNTLVLQAPGTPPASAGGGTGTNASYGSSSQGVGNYSPNASGLGAAGSQGQNMNAGYGFGGVEMPTTLPSSSSNGGVSGGHDSAPMGGYGGLQNSGSSSASAYIPSSGGLSGGGTTPNTYGSSATASSADPSSLGRKLGWMPGQPRSIEETGLRRTVIVDLILKSIYFAGEVSGLDLREQLKLPYDLLEPIIGELRRDKLVDMKGGGGGFGSISMVYFITNKGTENIRQTLDRNRYVGPAPITMDDYVKGVETQSIRKIKVPKRRLQTAFGHLIIDDYIFDGIGPALNSGTAILFYGPPGNGKTAICQGMVNTLGEGIYIPYAIEADGNIIKVFDEHNHKPIARPEGSPPEYDQRYVFCQRPLMMVGGELTLDMLDMSYSTDAKYYEAPFQMKANGGILLIDDFGRQKVSPKDLLNRWIVPLESQIDFISLVTGRKLKVPFDVFVAFATNLNPDDLVDDAFLRRVRYKLEVKRPDLSLFKKLFQLTCGSQKVPFDESGFRHLVSLYERDKRPMNACEPRNIVSAIVSLADYFEREPVMESVLIDRAYAGYFTKFQQFVE